MYQYVRYYPLTKFFYKPYMSSHHQVEFEPVVVTRTSPEGRMMSKWLVAARKKIGEDC